MILLVAAAFADDYTRFIQAEERDATVYQHAYAALIVKAVRVDAAVRAREAEERTALGATPPAEDDGRLRVVFGAYSHWREELAFSADGLTPWVLRATSGGRACTLVSVTGAEPTAWDRALYPFLTRWDTLYTATFDEGCSPAGLEVEWTGPRGHLRARWD